MLLNHVNSLKEKIDLVTFIAIILGMSGVLLIVGSSLSIQTNEQFIGNIVAFIMPISFAILVIVIRKYPSVDMVPAQFIAGVFAAIFYSSFLLLYRYSNREMAPAQNLQFDATAGAALTLSNSNAA